MRTLIIFRSIHRGNTERIAVEIAEVLNARLLRLEDANASDLENFDLIGFGSGIYFGKFHKTFFEFLEKLHYQYNKEAFVFNTRGARSASSNTAFKKALAEKGFSVIANFSCRGFNTFGPFKLIGGIAKGHPNKKDIANARTFAISLSD